MRSPIELLLVTALAIISAIAAASFTKMYIYSGYQCELLLIAYVQQDELAPAWYDEASDVLDYCGMGVEHEDGTRGTTFL